MITLTWLQMAHPNFQQAVRAIWDCPQLDGHTSYTAYRIKQKIEKADKEIRDLRIALTGKYGKKDAEGKNITDERGWITFETPEDNKKFEEEFTAEFSKRVVNMKVSKIDFQKLVGVRGLTPVYWEHLEPIVENFPPAEEEEPSQVVDTETAPIYKKVKMKEFSS